MSHCTYHPDRDIDNEIRACAAEGARADLAAGLPATCCPLCGRSHDRGYIDGATAYRCVHCGIVAAPGSLPEWARRHFLRER